MAGRHAREESAPGPGDKVVVEFVDAPAPDTRELMVIPRSGIPLRLERDGVEYALTSGRAGNPVTFDYFSVEDRPER